MADLYNLNQIQAELLKSIVLGTCVTSHISIDYLARNQGGDPKELWSWADGKEKQVSRKALELYFPILLRAKITEMEILIDVDNYYTDVEELINQLISFQGIDQSQAQRLKAAEIAASKILWEPRPIAIANPIPKGTLIWFKVAERRILGVTSTPCPKQEYDGVVGDFAAQNLSINYDLSNVLFCSQGALLAVGGVLTVSQRIEARGQDWDFL
ncbi:MAG: hypothetical protein DCF22_10290 [Leptolyngbya sp.]|nr:MAG: hypothetical protein DCF22_10290 [Leptolyngbya sp.]